MVKNTVLCKSFFFLSSTRSDILGSKIYKNLFQKYKSTKLFFFKIQNVSINKRKFKKEYREPQAVLNSAHRETQVGMCVSTSIMRSYAFSAYLTVTLVQMKLPWMTEMLLD